MDKIQLIQLAKFENRNPNEQPLELIRIIIIWDQYLVWQIVEKRTEKTLFNFLVLITAIYLLIVDRVCFLHLVWRTLCGSLCQIQLVSEFIVVMLFSNDQWQFLCNRQTLAQFSIGVSQSDL